MPSHEDIYDAYLSKDFNLLKAAGCVAKNKAKQIFNRSKVGNQIDELELFVERYNTARSCKVSASSNVIMHMHDEFDSYYNGIADDLLLIAAFEHFMCGELLQRGFIVHLFNKRNSVFSDWNLKDQKVHVTSIKQTARKSMFNPITINGGSLMKTDYIKLFSSEQKIINGLKAILNRRNESHFNANIYSSLIACCNEEFIAAVKLLKSKLHSQNE
ncbi:MAG: hypothetical protein ACPGR2_08890 [Psychrobium sp.]